MSDVNTKAIPYDWAEAKAHPHEEQAVWRMLTKRGIEGSLISSMLGLTDDGDTHMKTSTYSMRMHTTLQHNEDYVPTERFRKLIDRLVNAGWDIKSIANACGASRATIGRARKGGTWSRREFVERLEGVAA